MPRRFSLTAVAVFALSFGALAHPGMATAGTRIYEGREAAALRCANTLALTAVALSSAELIGEGEKNVMLGVTVRIPSAVVELHKTGPLFHQSSSQQTVAGKGRLRRIGIVQIECLPRL